MQKNSLTSQLCHIIKSYRESTGLFCTYRLADGSGCQECDECRMDDLCLLCSAAPEYADLCERQMISSETIARELCQPYIFQCPLGLTRWAVPAIQGDTQIATLYAGCVRIKPNLGRIEDTMPSHFENFVPAREVFSQAWNKAQFMTPEQIHYASMQLFYFVCLLLQTNNAIIQSAQKALNEQAILSEEISRQKSKQAKLISQLTADDSDYYQPAELDLGLSDLDEHELVGRIQMGDKATYKSILDKALGRIFLSETEDINTMKALLIELVISVGRIAFQRKASGDALFLFYSEAIVELQTLDSLTQISAWTSATFDKLADLIYTNRDEHTYSTVEQVTFYIKHNYASDLSLEDIAQAINYSPYYISRLFKEELNITIIDYLTEVRISKAKELLEKTELTVAAVAERIGYKDSLYCSRLFKKKVGISPSEYRRWWQGR